MLSSEDVRIEFAVVVTVLVVVVVVVFDEGWSSSSCETFVEVVTVRELVKELLSSMLW